MYISRNSQTGRTGQNSKGSVKHGGNWKLRAQKQLGTPSERSPLYTVISSKNWSPAYSETAMRSTVCRKSWRARWRQSLSLRTGCAVNCAAIRPGASSTSYTKVRYCSATRWASARLCRPSPPWSRSAIQGPHTLPWSARRAFWSTGAGKSQSSVTYRQSRCTAL